MGASFVHGSWSYPKESERRVEAGGRMTVIFLLLLVINLNTSAAFLPQRQIVGCAAKLIGSNASLRLSTKGNQAPSSELEGFSKYFRPDPEDFNAESFLLSLTPEKRNEIQHLLEQLHSSRRRKDYTVSDELTAKLRQHFGVRTYDQLWTTRKGAAPASYIRKKEKQSAEALYGPKGHPFEQVGGKIKSIRCSLSIKEINTLLSRHCDAKSQGRYEEAHAILFELNINGVQCNAERQLWRADGKKTWEDVQLPVWDRSVAPYSEASTEEVLNPGRQVRVRVEQLVNRRADTLVQEDVALAECLLWELWKTYGVEVNDSERIWSFQSQQADCPVNKPLPNTVERDTDLAPPVLFVPREPPVVCSYRSSVHSLPLPDDPTLRVECLIEERAQKREEGKFQEADAIRSELWMSYYVGLNDRLRQWSVGGVFDEKEINPE